MKIRMTEDSKRTVTVSEMAAVRKIMYDLKEDNYLKQYASMAARVASGKYDTFEILKVEAEIAKNCRIWNAYGEGTGQLDVWVSVYAYNSYHGFYDFGAYLTDIWAISGDNVEEIRGHMYIKSFLPASET